MSELRPYEREYDDNIRQDSEEDIRRSDRFDNNEVSVKTSLISFIIVIVVMSFSVILTYSLHQSRILLRKTVICFITPLKKCLKI